VSESSLLDDIIKSLEGLSEAQLADAAKEALKGTPGMMWVPNPGPQEQAYDCDVDELYFGGEVGGGKLQPIDAKVLTPHGWSAIGSLKVGSKICAVDGTVTEVIGVFPKGVVANYRFTFSDGGTCLAGLEHNWLGWWSGESRKIANVPTSGEAAAQKYTTKEIMDRMEAVKSNNRGTRFTIPVCAPVAFNVPGCPRRGPDGGFYLTRAVDPYLLGILLGDGCLSIDDSVTLTSADSEIEDYLFSTYGEDVVGAAKLGNAASQYRFRGATRAFLVEQFSKSFLGLVGHRADTKFIPKVYLFGSVDERWSLLQGLMDTDGWADKDGDTYYCTISKQLADDVTHLARSLGAIVTRTEKHPTYTYNGEKLDGQLAYALRIKMPQPDRMFRLTRKREICAGKIPQSMGRYLESIEYSHDVESVCIAVRHASSLYITEDFIVTHNTDLLIGLAVNKHKKSLLIRRINDDARGLADRMAEVLGHSNGLNRTLLEWRLADGRSVEFGGCQLEDDKQRYKGKPHDLIGFDEGSDLTESQFEFIKIWNRSADPKQKCRVVVASNPPTTAAGLWITKRWAAWLDKRHPNPARSGEIRWYIRNEDGVEIEVDGVGPHPVRGEMIKATSRTFIRSRLEDNPNYIRSGYKDRLHLLPEELQKAYRGGDYDVGLRDQPNQLIPAVWIEEAQKRWRPHPPEGYPMTTMGVDCSGGGTDPMIIAQRYDTWFAPLVDIPGKDIPMDAMGKFAMAHIISRRKDLATIVLDMGGGYGQSIFENLKENRIDVVPYKGAEATNARTADRQHGFYNYRSYAWWKMREALDPDQEQGSPIALPPDTALMADLSTPTFQIEARGVKIETKEAINKRLGRSTDRGDAVVMAWIGSISSAYGGNVKHRNGPVSVVTKRTTRNAGIVVKRRR
jgi:hypothetical protein